MLNPTALQFNLFGLDVAIHWYGVIIAVGLLLAIVLAMYHARREGHNPDMVLDLALVIIPLAVICARIYYVVFEWDYYATQPFWEVFAVWHGGLAIYGGVIGGFLGILLYAKVINKKVRIYELLDIVAPSLILGQAIGRWGNFVNQEAYGYAVYNPAWQWFPASVFIEADQQYHMATFFYESFWNFLVLAFLFFYFRNSKTRKKGNVFWFYLLLYGIGRAVIEGLRTDSLYWGTFRVSQWLSGVFVLVAAAVLILQYLKRRRERLDETPLDDTLKLQVDVPEPEEETGQNVQKAEEAAEPAAPEEGGEAPAAAADTAEAAPAQSETTDSEEAVKTE